MCSKAESCELKSVLVVRVRLFCFHSFLWTPQHFVEVFVLPPRKLVASTNLHKTLQPLPAKEQGETWIFAAWEKMLPARSKSNRHSLCCGSTCTRSAEWSSMIQLGWQLPQQILMSRARNARAMPRGNFFTDPSA